MFGFPANPNCIQVFYATTRICVEERERERERERETPKSTCTRFK